MAKGDNKKATRGVSAAPKELLLSKQNYIIIGVGLALVIIGLFLMSGGQNAPDQWNADEIYSFRRITLAPLVILGGLAVVVLAIFKSSGKEEVTNLGANQ